ncbi:MAG: PLD nuclease N-terminal domain-containing protein [Propionibacteriaceae bacterium]|jgi:hypothetical protein|nr:PLD nuclease N-terminal domain-containing protein [Propionibacteriaceae bacterium]
MGRVLPFIVIAALMIYALVELWQSDPLEVRAMPKWLWCVTILLLPGIGAIAWLIFGRPRNTGRGNGGGGGGRGPIAPDDDPDFLRSLNRTKRH